MKKIETTTDCVVAANELMEEAKQVTTRESHAVWWDKKVDVLRLINDSLETGYFIGEAYAELWHAKHILFKAETVAGNHSRAHQWNI